MKKLNWTESALSDLSTLDKIIVLRVNRALERFAETGSGDLKQLHRIFRPAFRLRVGDERVRLRQDAEAIYILRVQKRSEA